LLGTSGTRPALRPVAGRTGARRRWGALMRVSHWIGIDETGRGAIGLTRQDVIDALPGARTVAIASYSVWDLTKAVGLARTLPIQFGVERLGNSVGALRREIARW
jgi:hypothetical protein